MLRREVIKGLAISPIAFQGKKLTRLESALAELEAALNTELHGSADIQIRFDPKNLKVPFMMVAFRS